MIGQLGRRVLYFLRRDRFERELEEEMQLHLDLRAEERGGQGAQRQFGNATRVKEDSRGMWELGIGSLLQDIRYGVRTFLKTRGFTAIAVLTLGLGIGASTAVFSAVNAILLKPLPYPEADRIAIPWRQAPPGFTLGYNEIPWGLREFHVLENETKTFESLGAIKSDPFNLTGAGEATVVPGIRASAGFFPALGVAPALGRFYTRDEDRAGHEFVVILSDRLWRERFRADPGILGQSIRLNGQKYLVAGVIPAGFGFPKAAEMPGSFNFPREAQLWVPLALAPAPQPNEPDELALIGRLKPGSTMAQAQAEMDVFSRRFESQFPGAKGWFNMRVTPLALQVAGDTRRPLLLILAAVGVVLLIACSNVANLLLARSLGRRKEFTVRAALGAAQGRLIRQLLTESVLLASAGGAAGLALAMVSVRVVKILGPSNIPRLDGVEVDPRVLAFAIVVSLLTGIVFGLTPAAGTARENLVESLKDNGRGMAARHSVRNALVVSEVALALVLVVAAGLLVRTFFHVLSVNGGFNAARVLTFELSLPEVSYPDNDHIVALYHNVLDRLNAVPGVESAGISETVPMGGAGESSPVRILDHALPNPKERPITTYTIASPGYFSAVGTPILRGRGFVESDTGSSAPVTVISDVMARKFWPGMNPIGKMIGLGSPKFPLMMIVGIAADVKHLSLREEPGPEMYVPYTQKPWPSMLAMKAAVRTRDDPAAVTGYVREAIRSIDPDLPVTGVKTLAAIVDDSMTQPRFSMLLLGAFGGLAVVLASIGMYGVISYSVAQRTREIGIRIAMGAERRSVFGMVLGHGARLAGLGIAIGLVVALGVTRLMAGFLYGVGAADPSTFSGVCVLLASVALAACYVPARRATRVDPVIALRSE